MTPEFISFYEVPLNKRATFYKALARGWIRLHRTTDGHYKIRVTELDEDLKAFALDRGDIYVTHARAQEILGLRQAEVPYTHLVRSSHPFSAGYEHLLHLGDLWMEVLRRDPEFFAGGPTP